MNPGGFRYAQAFARNLGLVSPAEQRRLERLCVGLPGLGGVGGAHLQTLARMGIGAFRLADPDRYELVNFNRQLGACMQTVGRAKVEVAADTARAINPGAKIECFPCAVNAGNLDRFLGGVDVVVDGIEFFHVEDRRVLYRACRARRIPVVNAGPIGYGAAVIVFTPDGLGFDEYFGLRDGMTKAEMLVAFGLGLTPGLGGDVDPRYVDAERGRGPALASACMLCAAAAATEVLKLVTGRGRLSRPGRGVYIDPLRSRTVRLRTRPSLASLPGRFLRWAAFRRFPEFRRMHEKELALRARPPAALPAWPEASLAKEPAACVRP